MKHQPMRQGQTTTPGTTCPTLFDKCVGSLTSPANHVLTLKMQDRYLCGKPDDKCCVAAVSRIFHNS